MNAAAIAKAPEDNALPENDRFGVLTGPREVTFERILPGPIEKVWSFLVEGEKRKLWLAGGDFEPRVGGVAKLVFNNGSLTPAGETIPEDMQKYSGVMEAQGKVTAWDPPHTVAFSWWGEPDAVSEVVFQLSPESDGRVKLTLIHRALRDRSQMLMISGGWHAHLGVLVALVEGRTPDRFWTVLGGETGKTYERMIPEE